MLDHIFLSVLSTSLTTSFIIIFLLVLSPYINRRYASKWKYWVWILLTLRLLIPFNMSDMQNVFENLRHSLTTRAMQYQSDVYKYDTTQPPMQAQQKILLEIPSQMTEPLSPSKQSRVTSKVTFLMIMEIIWLTGGILFIGIHLCCYLIYRRKISQNAHRIMNDSIYGLYDKLFNELQLARRIPIITCDRADSPMVMGFIHPVLVLPAEEYSDEELYFILKHELIHYKRHDICLKLLFVLANAVHWFNPVIWLMQREAVVDMELSCDERVMLDADNTARKTYTEILFLILHNKCTNKTPLSTQFYGGKQVMKKRFRNILERSGKRSGLNILVCTLGLVIGLGFLVGCSVSESDRMAAHIMEGASVEQTATLFTGSGYSIYIPDNDWISCGSNVWQSAYNDRIRFWITCFADQDISKVKRDLHFSKGMLPDTEAIREDEMTGQKEDIITRVRLIEQPEASHVWAVFYCYPEEAIESAGAILPMIVDTFSAAETVKCGFGDMIPSSGETDANVLQFTNGLQLILPEAWNDKIVVEEIDSTRTLVISEKNNAKADGGGALVNLFYVSHSEDGLTFSADNPFQIFGEDAQKYHKVLGVYRSQDNEYALIYTRCSDAFYTNEDPKLRKDFQDLYKYVDEVQVITDNIPGFTECGLEDLDWIWME
ncbi:MAG: M56 family metallopeptidase [Lachnospiraceae bacterium]|nr:M56 family metallopeptidase [Lachnospiraceae bacterium]